ncbi:MAG: hypothetical protein K1W41_25290, partial [Lachnospiraceae bacterium]
SDFGVTGEDVRVGNCKYLLNQQTLSNPFHKFCVVLCFCTTNYIIPKINWNNSAFAENGLFLQKTAKVLSQRLYLYERTFSK